MICGHIPDGYEGKLRQRRTDHTAGVLRGQQCPHMIVMCSVKADLDFDSE